jgi:dolichol kinase
MECVIPTEGSPAMSNLASQTFEELPEPNTVGLYEPPSDSAVSNDTAFRPSVFARHFGHLSATEWRRRLLHILPGFLPIVLWFVFHHDPLSWDIRCIFAGIIIGIGVITALQYKRIARRGEKSNPACILGYTIPIFALLIFVPAHAELGFTVLAILSIGDGMATVGGLLLKGPKLPWNEEKSWAGSLCFVVFAIPFAAIIYAGEASPVIPFATALTICSIAVLCSAAMESVRSKINDNIRVGATSAVTLLAMQYAFVGFSA